MVNSWGGKKPFHYPVMCKDHRIREPQNHRLVEVGRDLEVMYSTPLLKQGYLDAVAQDHV